MKNIVNKFTVNKITILIFLLIFYTSQNTVLFGTNNITAFVRIGQACLFVSIIYLLCKYKISVSYKEFVFLNLLMIPVVLAVIINGDFQLVHLYVCISIVGGFILSKSIDIEKLINTFNKCLYWVAAFSIGTMIVAQVYPSIFVFFPQISNIEHYGFFYLGLSVCPTDDYFYRNYGLFREPGVFQYYLNLGILFEILSKHVNYKRLAVFLFALIITFSTIGYICAMILAIVYVLQKKGEKKLIVLVPCVVVFFAFLQFYVLENIDWEGYSVWDKLDGVEDIYSNANVLNISMVTRLGSIIVDINLIPLSPLVGLAQQKVYDLYPVISMQILGLYLKYPTDSYFLQFAKYGVLFGSVISYGYYRLCKKMTGDILSLLLICIFFFLELLSENYSADILFYMFIWHGLRDEPFKRFDSIKKMRS